MYGTPVKIILNYEYVRNGWETFACKILKKT